VGVDPFQDFAVTFSFGQLLQEGFQIKAEKPDKMLVGGRIVVVLAVFLDELGTAFIENAGQEDKASKR
jgi:ABC-type proline/glycine betaine transport system permease subunit